MGMKRGPSGQVRNIPHSTVRDIFLDTLEHLPPAGEAFTRQEVKEAIELVMKEGGLAPEPADVEALQHAFFRTLFPVAAERGKHVMPTHADDMIRHRGYRISGGKLDVPDMLQLASVLDTAVKRGEVLTPTLAKLQDSLTVTLRALRLPVNGAPRRV